MGKFRDFIREDFGAALQEPSSAAAQQAKKLGLQYVGFGKYEDPKTQQITHVVQNEKLVPFTKASKTNSFKAQTADEYGSYSKELMPNIEQTQQYLASYYKPESFSEDELTAIQQYTDTGFFDINERLYALPSNIKAKDIMPEFDGDPIPQQVASLDSALNKIKCPVDSLVYVGLGPDYDITKFVPGSSFVFKGFRSTTLNPNITLNYNQKTNKTAMRNQTIVLQIRVKKGSKGVMVDEYSANPGESEYLLPRSSKVKILSGPNKLVGSNAYSGDSNLEVLYFDCELSK